MARDQGERGPTPQGAPSEKRRSEGPAPRASQAGEAALPPIRKMEVAPSSFPTSEGCWFCERPLPSRPDRFLALTLC